MTIYNTGNIQFVWRGLTLTGFGKSQYEIKQKNPSLNTEFGIGGDVLCSPSENNNRIWQITSSFTPLSPIYPILEQDNLNKIVDTLIIRDLNTGITDTFSKCYIMAISEKKDSNDRTVVWESGIRNGR